MPRLVASRRWAEACAPLPAAHAASDYARHAPERTLPAALVQVHDPDFLVRIEAEDRCVPAYVGEPALARPPATGKTGRKERLNFLYPHALAHERLVHLLHEHLVEVRALSKVETEAALLADYRDAGGRTRLAFEAADSALPAPRPRKAASVTPTRQARQLERPGGTSRRHHSLIKASKNWIGR